MSTVDPTKKQLDKMADILAEAESVEEAAKAAMDYAFEVYESRAKFVVVGRVAYSKGYVKPQDARASTVAVGPYSTEGKALAGAQSLLYSAATHEEAKTYVLPMFSGSPSAWYAQRKKASDGEGMSAWWKTSNPDPYWASDDGADRCYRAFTNDMGLIALCDRVRDHDGDHEAVPWRVIENEREEEQ